LYLLITGSSVFTTTTLALASGNPILRKYQRPYVYRHGENERHYGGQRHQQFCL